MVGTFHDYLFPVKNPTIAAGGPSGAASAAPAGWGRSGLARHPGSVWAQSDRQDGTGILLWRRERTIRSTEEVPHDFSQPLSRCDDP
jgi:hypothetical protein